MFLKIILFCSLIMSVSIAQSGWTPAFESTVSQLNQKDKRAFDDALKSCVQARDRKLSNFEFTPDEANVFLGTAGDVNYAVEKVLSSGWQEGSRVFRQTGGLGMYLNELLNSYGFKLAMKKCFNGDERKENLYVIELFLIDAAVKGVYMGGAYLSAKYLLARRWGIVLLTTLIVSPISGDTPKPQEMSYIEQVQKNLDLIAEEVRKITGKPRNP